MMAGAARMSGAPPLAIGRFSGKTGRKHDDPPGIGEEGKGSGR
jgi:hypothetical protein